MRRELYRFYTRTGRGIRRRTRLLATSNVAGLAPAGAWLADQLSARSPHLFPLEDVVAVMQCLSDDGLDAWLAGGWGVDALLGSQTRLHTDLDLVVPDTLTDGWQAATSLRRLRFQHQQTSTSGLWWTQARHDLLAPDGRRIELLSLDWALLDHMSRLLVPAGTSPDLRRTWLTRGSLARQHLPCLSKQAQELLHLGYPSRETDEWDMALLDGTRASTGPTSLVLPVFALDDWSYQVWREIGHPLRLPHVTVLDPFLPADSWNSAVRRELASLAAEVTPFEITLTRLCCFDDKIAYLRPEPDDLFRQLIERFRRSFPDFPPYGGAFPDVVPHLTLAVNAAPATLRHATALGRSLPLRARADQIWVVAGSTTRPIERFPLGRADSPGRPKISSGGRSQAAGES